MNAMNVKRAVCSKITLLNFSRAHIPEVWWALA